MRTLKVYTATWCQPCQQLKRVINDFSSPEVNVVTIDIEAWKEEAKAANIRSVPTMILYENEVELARKTGVCSKEALGFFVSKDYGFTA